MQSNNSPATGQSQSSIPSSISLNKSLIGAANNVNDITDSIIPENIWDIKVIETFGRNRKNFSWKCKWCNTMFQGMNATKLMAHLSKTSGFSIKICQAKIPSNALDTYKANMQYRRKKETQILNQMMLLLLSLQNSKLVLLLLSNVQNDRSHYPSDLQMEILRQT